MTKLQKRVHSVKLPKLYKEAARVLQAHSECKGSIRNLVYSTHSPQLYGRLLALVTRVQQHSATLSHILTASRLLTDNPRLQQHTARVLVAELLWGSGRLPMGSSTDAAAATVARPVLAVNTCAPQLRRLATEAGAPPLAPSIGAAPNCRLQTSPIGVATIGASGVARVRYARINTLCTSPQAVLEELTQHGWTQMHYQAENCQQFTESVKMLKGHEFLADLHVDNVMVFGNASGLATSDLYNSGRLVLQDKASCIPAVVLSPLEGEYIIDACAAPGMKTSHLAALMNNTGTIVAVERDAKRLATLNTVLSALGVANCRTVCSDFLHVAPEQHAECTAILLDPSCSGTGMIDRPAGEAPPNAARLKRLANLQAMLLRHALSFPNVTRVVYSTCSNSVQENEQVVAEILSDHPEWKLARIAPALWRQFGQAEFDFSKRCLRTNVELDLCCGFFVAMFRRRRRRNKKECGVGDDRAEILGEQNGAAVAEAEIDNTQQTIKRKKKRKKID